MRCGRAVNDKRPGGGHPVRAVGCTWRLYRFDVTLVTGELFRLVSPIVSIVSLSSFTAGGRRRGSRPSNWNRLSSSSGEGVDPGAFEQIGQLLAGIKHARLHGALRNADDLADFFHRLLMVVDEIDDLAMRWRKL